MASVGKKHVYRSAPTKLAINFVEKKLRIAVLKKVEFPDTFLIWRRLNYYLASDVYEYSTWFFSIRNWKVRTRITENGCGRFTVKVLFEVQLFLINIVVEVY